MPKIDLSTAPVLVGSRYPAPFDEPCRGRRALRLSEASGLTHIGANLVTIDPGAWASQRHWHTHEDEFVMMVSGELVLVEDDGETVLRAGDCAAHPAGAQNGHHLQNRSAQPATFLVVSNRDNADAGDYPDIDMRFTAGRYTGGGGYAHKDGAPYPKRDG